MNKLIANLVLITMIGAMISGGGLANFSIAIVIIIYLINTMFVSLAFFADAENLKAAYATKIDRNKLGIALNCIYIGAAAYQGFTFSAVMLCLLWMYSYVIVSTIRHEAKKGKAV